DEARLELCARRAREAGAAPAPVDMMGGQAERGFDCGASIVDEAGQVAARGPQFEETLLIADLELPPADPAVPPGETPADAHDGTTITIHRVTLPGLPPPPP